MTLQSLTLNQAKIKPGGRQSPPERAPSPPAYGNRWRKASPAPAEPPQSRNLWKTWSRRRGTQSSLPVRVRPGGGAAWRHAESRENRRAQTVDCREVKPGGRRANASSENDDRLCWELAYAPQTPALIIRQKPRRSLGVGSPSSAH